MRDVPHASVTIMSGLLEMAGELWNSLGVALSAKA